MTHVHEVALEGPADGNPYLDVTLHAVFSQGSREVRVKGFHDGKGRCLLRFMPDAEGEWTWRGTSNAAALDGLTGDLAAQAPREGVHGPARVKGRFHLAHADGTPFRPFGTTCYAWTYQPPALQEATLAGAGFSKVRMGLFPKDYPFNENEPLQPVFLPRADGTLDVDRPNAQAFRHFEAQVARLDGMGIEADVILSHPYDRWGYATMSRDENRRYVAYAAARLSAHRNVWWALADEYDVMLDTIPMEDWDGFCHLLEEHDPVRHLRSIHNGDPRADFDHRKPWITHVCIQNWDVKRFPEWRDAFGKPVVNDEPEYEGNIYPARGNIAARELVHRFWVTVTRGGYAGHGETYAHPEDVLWWAKGGRLHGEAPPRLAFLRRLLEEDNCERLEPMGPSDAWPWGRVSGARDLGGRVSYIDFGEPRDWTTGLPTDGTRYAVDVIDTWAMTVEPAEVVLPLVPHPVRHGAIVRGGGPDVAFGVRLPGRPHLALRVRRLDERGASWCPSPSAA